MKIPLTKSLFHGLRSLRKHLRDLRLHSSPLNLAELIPSIPVPSYRHATSANVGNSLLDYVTGNNLTWIPRAVNTRRQSAENPRNRKAHGKGDQGASFYIVSISQTAKTTPRETHALTATGMIIFRSMPATRTLYSSLTRRDKRSIHLPGFHPARLNARTRAHAWRAQKPHTPRSS